MIGMRRTDRLATLPFEPLRILAMKINIARISTRVHQNLHMRKTLWDKTTYVRKLTVLQFISFGPNWLEISVLFLSFEYIFL